MELYEYLDSERSVEEYTRRLPKVRTDTISEELTTISLLIVLPPNSIILKTYIPEKFFMVTSKIASKFLTFRFFSKGSILVYRYLVSQKFRKKINKLIRERFNYFKRIKFWAKR